MEQENVIVVTTVTGRRGLLEILERQLREAGVKFHVNMVQPAPMTMLTSITYRVRVIDEMLEKFPTYEKFVFVDGWDMLFFGTEQDLYDSIPTDRVLIGAEKNCWPATKETAEAIPETGTPWKYANGGCVAGTRAQLMEWVEAYQDIMIDPTIVKVDQEFYNQLLAHGGFERMVSIDSHTQLVYNMFLDEGELVQDIPGRPCNSVTYTFPSFIHFNGGVDARPFLRTYGIEPSKSMFASVDYVLCTPGSPSSLTQASSVTKAFVDLMLMGKLVGQKGSFSNNIYSVRNNCLKGFRTVNGESRSGSWKDQKPFEGMYSDYDRIIWIDSDNVINTPMLMRLLSYDVDIVAAVYNTNWAPDGVGPENSCCGTWKLDGNVFTYKPLLLSDLPTAPRNEKGLIEVDYTGFGLCVIKKGVFEALAYPWFHGETYEWIDENGDVCAENITDDVGFCLRAKQSGFKVFVDPECRIPHEKLQGI